MEDNKFWARIWTLIAVVACIAIATVGGCTVYESKRIADAINGGADPIDARCGIGGTGNSYTACAIRAARK